MQPLDSFNNRVLKNLLPSLNALAEKGNVYCLSLFGRQKHIATIGTLSLHHHLCFSLLALTVIPRKCLDING